MTTMAQTIKVELEEDAYRLARGHFEAVAPPFPAADHKLLRSFFEAPPLFFNSTTPRSSKRLDRSAHIQKRRPSFFLVNKTLLIQVSISAKNTQDIVADSWRVSIDKAYLNGWDAR